jgi:hypothetical protein
MLSLSWLLLFLSIIIILLTSVDAQTCTDTWSGIRYVTQYPYIPAPANVIAGRIPQLNWLNIAPVSSIANGNFASKCSHLLMSTTGSTSFPTFTSRFFCSDLLLTSQYSPTNCANVANIANPTLNPQTTYTDIQNCVWTFTTQCATDRTDKYNILFDVISGVGNINPNCIQISQCQHTIVYKGDYIGAYSTIPIPPGIFYNQTVGNQAGQQIQQTPPQTINAKFFICILSAATTQQYVTQTCTTLTTNLVTSVTSAAQVTGFDCTSQRHLVLTATMTIPLTMSSSGVYNVDFTTLINGGTIYYKYNNVQCAFPCVNPQPSPGMSPVILNQCTVAALPASQDAPCSVNIANQLQPEQQATRAICPGENVRAYNGANINGITIGSVDGVYQLCTMGMVGCIYQCHCLAPLGCPNHSQCNGRGTLYEFETSAISSVCMDNNRFFGDVAEFEISSQSCKQGQKITLASSLAYN